MLRCLSVLKRDDNYVKVNISAERVEKNYIYICDCNTVNMEFGK